MSLRRSSAKLFSMGKAHTPLHVIIWQAREAQSALLAAAKAQKTLFTDIAAWASQENRALSDVCSSVSEIINLYATVQMQIALAYESFRKDMMLILEGEKRCDTAQRRLEEAEEKRVKLRKQVLKIQNKNLKEGENPKKVADYCEMQTQLAEAERTADRFHVEACDVSREQEAVKLVVVRNALTKLSDSHLTMSTQARIIFEGNQALSQQLPEPPPPGDPLSCLRYEGHDNTRAVIERVKSQVHVTAPVSRNSPVRSPMNLPSPPHRPTAPPGSAHRDHDPPPPYNPNSSYFSSYCCHMGKPNRDEQEDYRRRRHSTGSRRAHRHSNQVTPISSAHSTRIASPESPYTRNPPAENPFTIPDPIYSNATPTYSGTRI